MSFDVGGCEAAKCASELVRGARSMPDTAVAGVPTLVTADGSDPASAADLMLAFATANFSMRTP
jgi:hypothetical protein